MEQKDRVVAVKEIDSEGTGPGEEEGIAPVVEDTGRGAAVVVAGRGYGMVVVVVRRTGLAVEDTGSEGIAVEDAVEGIDLGVGTGLEEARHIVAVVADKVERRKVAVGDRDCVKAGPGVDLEDTAGILADPHRDLAEGGTTYFDSEKKFTSLIIGSDRIGIFRETHTRARRVIKRRLKWGWMVEDDVQGRFRLPPLIS